MRVHALVNVGEVAQRIVPALLKAQIENDVLEIALCERAVILVAASEMYELGWRGKVLHKCERAVDGDRPGINPKALSEVAPDKDRWRLALMERLPRVILGIGVAL